MGETVQTTETGSGLQFGSYTAYPFDNPDDQYWQDQRTGIFVDEEPVPASHDAPTDNWYRATLLTVEPFKSQTGEFHVQEGLTTKDQVIDVHVYGTGFLLAEEEVTQLSDDPLANRGNASDTQMGDVLAQAQPREFLNPALEKHGVNPHSIYAAVYGNAEAGYSQDADVGWSEVHDELAEHANLSYDDRDAVETHVEAALETVFEDCYRSTFTWRMDELNKHLGHS